MLLGSPRLVSGTEVVEDVVDLGFVVSTGGLGRRRVIPEVVADLGALRSEPELSPEPSPNLETIGEHGFVGTGGGGAVGGGELEETVDPDTAVGLVDVLVVPFERELKSVSGAVLILVASSDHGDIVGQSFLQNVEVGVRHGVHPNRASQPRLVGHSALNFSYNPQVSIY